MPQTPGSKNLTSEAIQTICKLSDSGVSNWVIADSMGYKIRAIQRVLKDYHANTLSPPKHSPGRPQKLGERDIRSLDRIIKKNRKQTLQEITNSLDLGVSPRTVQPAIHSDLEMHGRRARKAPFLKPDHRRIRKTWARKYSTCNMEDWSHVIWTDEASVEIGFQSCPVLVWRTAQEEYNLDCLSPTFKSGWQSLMIWACITYDKCGPLVFLPKDKQTAADYVDLILSGPLFDTFQELSEKRGAVLVVEDGAPIHTAGVSKRWWCKHLMENLEHPACSPDLNPIEHVWRRLKERVSKRSEVPKKTWRNWRRCWKRSGKRLTKDLLILQLKACQGMSRLFIKQMVVPPSINFR